MDLTLDRLEGDRAVFIDGDGKVTVLPSSALPCLAADGDVFRVTGYSGYFTLFDRDLQNDIIKRTEQKDA